MEITVRHFANGKYPEFNVMLHTAPGSEPFLEIKGCRIVEGKNGPFVSWPSSKRDNGKWWQHVYAGEKFAAAVLKKAQEGQRKAASSQRSNSGDFSDMDDDIPFIDPMKSRAFCLAVG